MSTGTPKGAACRASAGEETPSHVAPPSIAAAAASSNPWPYPLALIIAMRATPGLRVALTAAALSEIAAVSTSSHFCGLCMSLLGAGGNWRLGPVVGDPAYEPERGLLGRLAQWVVGDQAADRGDAGSLSDGKDLRRQVVGVDDSDIDSRAVPVSEGGGDAAHRTLAVQGGSHRP